MPGLVSAFGCIVAVFATFATTVLIYWKWKLSYFARKKIPFLPPVFPHGNLTPNIKGQEFIGITLHRLYREMKSQGWKYGGLYFFTRPVLMILDLDLVKSIFIKDFEYFPNRNTYSNEADDPLSAHLVNINGPRWKSLRAKLSPIFTSGKLKMMFQALAQCEGQLHHRLDQALGQPIDIKNILSCFTIDVIGSVAFGIDCNALSDQSSLFQVYARRAANNTRYQTLKWRFASTFPQLAKLLHVVITDQEVTEFFMKLLADTVEYRETHQIQRNDLLQVLIELTKSQTGEKLTMKELAAQSFVFFIAGFDSSSTVMSFALYALARHPAVQEQLREEVVTTIDRHGGELTYDAIQDMGYLSQVLDETLRLYSPAPFTARVCQADYKVPGHDLVIEKGTVVGVPITGIHMDEDYYQDPEDFDPGRFSKAGRAARHCCSHLPFGDGPRMCIGMRFGYLQSKMALCILLRRYRFTVNDRTVQPLEFKPSNIILSVAGEIWLNAEKL